MLTLLRIFTVLVATPVGLVAIALAESTDLSSNCVADWQTFVELTDQISSSLPEFSGQAFLFADQEANLYNCRNEPLSASYLEGVESYLSELLVVIKDMDTDYSCAVTQISTQYDQLNVVWLPEFEPSDIIEQCKQSILKTLTGFESDDKY